MESQSQHPLAGLELLVRLICFFMFVVVGATLFGSVVGSSSIPGVTAEVCVSTQSGEYVAFPGGGADGDRAGGPVNVADGIDSRAESIQLCDPDPDVMTRLLGVIGLVVWALAPLLFFGLLWRMLRSARLQGVFADRIPANLRTLGAFLLIWAVVGFMVTGIVNGLLLNRMVEVDELILFASNDFPWLLVLLGVAFLGLSRVMALAVEMRRDVEGTI